MSLSHVPIFVSATGPGRWTKQVIDGVGKPMNPRDGVGEGWSPKGIGALPREERGLDCGKVEAAHAQHSPSMNKGWGGAPSSHQGLGASERH